MRTMTVLKGMVALGLLVGSGAMAEEVNLGSKSFNKEDVVNALTAPPSAGKAKGKTRAIFVKEEKFEPQALSVEINFAKGSDTLTTDAQDKLNILGQALTSEQLKGYAFQVEGHTDTTGNEGYNLDLSKRRAISVKSYLAKQYKVPEDRLAVVGKGASELLDKENPTSERNRRVKIINLGKQ